MPEVEVVVELGLGLAGLGRPSGPASDGALPSSAQAASLLEAAWDRGVRLFDTAASYGPSEERLGAFLGRLAPAQRARAFVATKCGEELDPATGATRIDHSRDALRASIEQSLARLSRVSLLQIHKTTPAVLREGVARRVLEEYRVRDVAGLGASVTDLESAMLALEDDLFDAVQLPFHAGWQDLGPAFPVARRLGKRVLVNRPFGGGRLFREAASPADRARLARRALELVLSQPFSGAVLVGTRDPIHLDADLTAFRAALDAARGGEP